MAICLVTRVRDHAYRDGLLVSAKILAGVVEVGMPLHDEAGHQTRVIQLEFLSPRDVATVEVTFLVERKDPSPAHENAILWTIDDSGRRPTQADFFVKYYAENPYSNPFHPRHRWPRNLPPSATSDVIRQIFGAADSTHPAPPTPTRPETMFLVTQVEDHEDRHGLLVTGKTLTGKIEVGMTLHDVAGHQTRVIQLEDSVPKRGEVTILVERTTPSPAQPQAVLTTMPATK